MKKFFAMMMVAMMAASFTACNSDKEKDGGKDEATTTKAEKVSIEEQSVLDFERIADKTEEMLEAGQTEEAMEYLNEAQQEFMGKYSDIEEEAYSEDQLHRIQHAALKIRKAYN